MSGPNLNEITESLKEYDGSGSGILSVKQTKAALRDIENLPFTKEEIEEHIELALDEDLAGTSDGKIKLGPFANYLAFEVKKKIKKQKKKQQQQQNNNNNNTNNNNTNNNKQDNPFLNFDMDDDKDDKLYSIQVTRSPQEKNKNNTSDRDELNDLLGVKQEEVQLTSPTEAVDIPDWFGHSIDSPMSPQPQLSTDVFDELFGPPQDTKKSQDDSTTLQVRKLNENRFQRHSSSPNISKKKKSSPRKNNNNDDTSGLIAPPRKRGDQSPRSKKRSKSPRSPRSKSPRGPVSSNFSFATRFDDEDDFHEVYSPRKTKSQDNERLFKNEDEYSNNNNNNKKNNNNNNNNEHNNKTQKKEEDTKNENKDKEKRRKKKKRRKRTDAVAEMKRGTAMLKYGRRGFPHFRRFQLSHDNARLLWYSRKKSIQETNILVGDVKDILEGQQTEVFRQCTQRTLEKASFSIVYGDKLKTLDLVAKSFEEAQLWVKGLKGLMRANKQGKLHKVAQILVDVNFTDISKPSYRDKDVDLKPGQGYSNVELLRTVETTLDQSKKTFKNLGNLSKNDTIQKYRDFKNISILLSEIEQRIDEMQFALEHKSMSLSNLKRDIWVLKVDVTVLEEKLKVIIKHHGVFKF